MAGIFGPGFIVAIATSRHTTAPVIVFRILFGLLGFYLFYVGYLSWRKFSPLAVRHVCGTCTVLLFGALAGGLEDMAKSPHSEAAGILAVIWCLSMAWFYRCITAYLTERLFGTAMVKHRNGNVKGG